MDKIQPGQNIPIVKRRLPYLTIPIEPPTKYVALEKVTSIRKQTDLNGNNSIIFVQLDNSKSTYTLSVDTEMTEHTRVICYKKTPYIIHRIKNFLSNRAIKPQKTDKKEQI